METWVRTDYLSKMYLAYLYMCTWVRSENVNPDAFMITQDSKEVENLMGFHTSITMGYVESALFFCAMIETTKDRVKKPWIYGTIQRHTPWKESHKLTTRRPRYIKKYVARGWCILYTPKTTKAFVCFIPKSDSWCLFGLFIYLFQHRRLHV